MTGDPPIGTEDTIRPVDPDASLGQRQRRLDAEYPTDGPVPGRADPVAGGTLQDRADAIVRREGGVGDFANADAADGTPGYRVEDYPGQDNPEAFADTERDHNRDGDGNDLPDAAAGALRGLPFVPGANTNNGLPT